jgi:2-methylcitrate dehydratase
VAVEYPTGHRCRHEGIPLLEAKFRRNLDHRFPKERLEAINELVDMFAI